MARKQKTYEYTNRGWILAKQIITSCGQLPCMPGEVQHSIISRTCTLESVLHLNPSWSRNKSLKFLVSISQFINRNVSNYHMGFVGECMLSIHQCLAHSKTQLSVPFTPFPQQPLSSVYPQIYYRVNQQNYKTSHTPTVR